LPNLNDNVMRLTEPRLVLLRADELIESPRKTQHGINCCNAQTAVTVGTAGDAHGEASPFDRLSTGVRDPHAGDRDGTAAGLDGLGRHRREAGPH
jgi:hypothetical protein